MARKALSEKQFLVQRFSKTTLRAIHILGVTGAGGGILMHVPQDQWLVYWIMAMSTGAAMMLWEVVRDWRWLIQLKGVLTVVKLGLLCLFIPFATYKPELLITVVLLSVIVSHGPASLRHFSIVHGRRIDGKKEVKG
ncbi:hypothetical protein CXF83_05075 [Shewanella sp. Choline-02u-19]|jgi:hypothetical protein|uniref:hypothetical protein n=1 Tax=unclassified Shewanella TaxID=196818 RepID=UPI000C32158F|nr:MULTISPECIES: hypothetical protein [unclassified Shewanella]PKG56520.1 hypothetical protein CXF82_14485 [Shewanella sp. GutDb-MelDb]PKG74117.1 hypothetical protein CXF86_14230 [Shewanella sp. GutCb]PKH56430.1 hypothetical protein CXF84_13400 [Shewanella sp. Bg11-22]PKI30015.1 hypothetical protein CXF83_05075 [Shewanella sp. Choline-02u-19]